MSFMSHHHEGTYWQHDLPLDVNFDHLVEVISSGFSAVKTGCSFHPHLFVLCTLEGSHYVSLTLKGWGTMFHLLELCKDLEFSCMRELSSGLTFIYFI